MEGVVFRFLDLMVAWWPSSESGGPSTGATVTVPVLVLLRYLIIFGLL